MTAPLDPPPVVRLDAESVEQLAVRVSELLTAAALQPTPPPVEAGQGRLLTAAEVAGRWQIDRAWVYQHASELGAIKLGRGTRPRLRFSADHVDAYLNAPPPEPHRPATQTTRPVQSAGRERVDLLPIRGHSELTSPRPKPPAPRR